MPEHFRGDLLGRQRFGAEVAQVVERQVEGRIALRARVEHVGQREDVVAFVFLIKYVDAFAGFELRHVFPVVHEHRFDGLHLGVLYLGQEGALRVAVGGDGRDFRGCDLLLIGVLAFAFVDDGVTFGTEVLVGPVHHILLGDLFHAVQLADVVGPLLAVDERVDVEHGALVVFVELVHQLHLVVVDRSLDQPFVELSGANLRRFGQQQVAHFVERLSGFRTAAMRNVP